MLLTPVDIPFAAGGPHDLSLNRNMIKLVKGDRLHLAELQKIQISKKGKFAVTDVFGGRFVRVVSIREKDEDLWKKKDIGGQDLLPSNLSKQNLYNFQSFHLL